MIGAQWGPGPRLPGASPGHRPATLRVLDWGPGKKATGRQVSTDLSVSSGGASPGKWGLKGKSAGAE